MKRYDVKIFSNSKIFPYWLHLLKWINTGIQISPDVDKQNIVPFTECVNEVPWTVNGTSYMRWQLPIILAYSITAHKSQSITAHNGIVYEPSKTKPFARGLPYVAISRATDLDKVTLLSAIRPATHSQLET